MGFGFVAARFGLFLREELPVGATLPRHVGVSLPVGVSLIMLGVIVIVCSGVRHHRYLRALDQGNFRSVFGSTFAFSIVGVLALIGLGLALYLWKM